jgi:hypothetical protein
MNVCVRMCVCVCVGREEEREKERERDPAEDHALDVVCLACPLSNET